MKTTKQVRRSVSLPEPTARKVASIARRHRLSDNRVMVELIEEGIEARKAKEKAFFELAERFFGRFGRSEAAGRGVRPLRVRRVMPRIESWSRLPQAVRDHLIARMRDRKSVLMI
jgi:hypothetical protein